MKDSTVRVYVRDLDRDTCVVTASPDVGDRELGLVADVTYLPRRPVAGDVLLLCMDGLALPPHADDPVGDCSNVIEWRERCVHAPLEALAERVRIAYAGY